jgi:hypothetical protein
LCIGALKSYVLSVRCIVMVSEDIDEQRPSRSLLCWWKEVE